MYGQKFKALRLQQHISLEQAANRVISPSTLSRWENNKSRHQGLLRDERCLAGPILLPNRDQQKVPE